MTDQKKILVVEGNQAARREIVSILENWGCHVSFANDKQDGYYKTESRDFALVIVGSETPGMETSEFVVKIKTRQPETEILAISMEISVMEAVTVMKSGALDYIAGPITQEQLRVYVERIFDSAKEKIPGHVSSRRIRIITQNMEMQRILSLVEQVADSTASILIKGESGTGKELFARFIHEKSRRNKRPFVAVNCAALPENLLESELFGHERGAFTGAIARKAGKFEQADGGTLLLDEITEMQLHLQSKLLRVIQEKEVDRVGGGAPVSVDVRIVATTNRNILEWVEKGEFREDLYYRLNVIPLNIPPLRNRLDDIDILTDHFIKKFNAIDGRHVKCLTKDAMALLKSLPLRGNVRELENILQRAVLLAKTDTIAVDDLFLETDLLKTSRIVPEKEALPVDFLDTPLKDMERKMIFHTLDKTGGNRTHAATLLGISVRTLRNKLNEYRGEGLFEDDSEPLD